MVNTRLFSTALAGFSLTLLIACGQTVFEAALPTTLEDVDRIRNSEALEPQQKRDALTQLGIDPVTVNGLLQEERLANQFGGDLRSAFEKVSNDRLTELTPDEVQYYGDATAVTTYDDSEAQATVDFFIDNNISSLGELENLLDDLTIELPDGVDEANLRGVFINTSLDDVRDELP